MNITRDQLIGIKYTYKHTKPRLDSTLDWLGLNTCTRCNVIQRSEDLFWDVDHPIAVDYGSLCSTCVYKLETGVKL